MMRGRPFAVRLAVLLAGVVIVVLVAAGWVVNRAASRSLEETLGPRDEQRLELAVTVVEEALERGVEGRPLRFLLQRIAGESGGMVRVVDASGEVVAEAGRMPPRTTETESLTRDLSASAGGGAFELVLPSGQGPFVRTFNAALLLTGIVTVAALLVAAVFVVSRMTRPLREVAEAARRLGGGDLGARARGGSDAESAELAVGVQRHGRSARAVGGAPASRCERPGTRPRHAGHRARVAAAGDGRRHRPGRRGADRARAGCGCRPVGRDRSARRADAGRGGAASALPGTRRHGRSRARDRGLPGRPPS